MSPIVLVTGASRGIGLSVTRIFLERKVRVVTISRSCPPELENLSASYSDSLVIVRGDVTDPSVVSAAITQAKDKFGSLDALVLNAGTLEPLSRISGDTAADVDAWRKHFDVNFFSLVTALQAATPSLKASTTPGGARVIFVSSGAATGGTIAWGPYNAGKAAMNSLARTFANEEPSIISIAFRPGVVDTEMQAGIRKLGTESMQPNDYSKFVELHDSKKLKHPDVPAGVIVRLVLEAPKELSGQFVNIDGPECAAYKS
ncbi:NAD(P)-binding protein [Auriculariales sp. MPI-PUGE-AT-0066]|nr:NAD(P)-binding protein [Auriculariales sp. MPI-PUGE-AT-0066]